VSNEKVTYLKHPLTQKVIRIKNGFSWTVAIFGLIALLIRRQWKPFVIILTLILLLEVILYLINIELPGGISTGLWVGYGMLANEHLLTQRLNEGYEII